MTDSEKIASLAELVLTQHALLADLQLTLAHVQRAQATNPDSVLKFSRMIETLEALRETGLAAREVARLEYVCPPRPHLPTDEP